MAVKDTKIAQDAKVALEHLLFPLVVVASKTNRPFGVVRPGFDFRLTGAGGYCLDETGAVTAQVFVLGAEGLVTAPTFSVHSTPEQMAATAFVGRASSVLTEKAAATAITFTAAHVITANKFGIILIQMDSAGAYSTKVPAATQAYDTAAAALAALPAADSGKVAVARLAIANNAGDWTANTDDLTDGSDVTTAAFTSATPAGAALSAAIAFADGAYVPGTLSSTVADLVGTSSEDIVVVYTSDGTGALVNGHLNVQFRPTPLNGEA